MNETAPVRRNYHLTPYNGFSHEERVASLSIQNAAFRSGALLRPTICSICGFSRPDDLKGAGYIFSHLEDYRRPLEILPCSKLCHAALHARFRDPERWLRIVERHGRSGLWFTKLSFNLQSQFTPFDVTYPNGIQGSRAGALPLQSNLRDGESREHASQRN